jgi:predicted nucleic acid-binding protein
MDIADSSDFKVVWVSESDHRAGVQLLKSRPDKHYSLCDAVSFILIRRFNLTDALTTDHHFEQEGFVRLLRP